MTATLVADETDLQVALRRLDELALRIAASKALSRAEAERHADLGDITALYAALLPLTRTAGGS